MSESKHTRAIMLKCQIDSLDVGIKRAEDKLNQLCERRHKLRDERARLVSRFKPLDRVRVTQPLDHRNEHAQARVFEIVEVRADAYSDGLMYMVNEVKKDGEPGSRMKRLHLWGSQRLEKVPS